MTTQSLGSGKYSAGSVGRSSLYLMLASCLWPTAQAQTDLGFESQESAWVFGRSGNSVVVDTETSREGTRSVRIDHAAGGAVDRIQQQFSTNALAGNRLRVDAFVKTAISGEGVAALWIRVDGEQELLYIDRSGDRGARGTRGWTRLTIDAPLGANARRVTFGAEFRGAGTVWLDDFRVTALNASELPALSAERHRYVERGLDVIAANSIRRQALDWDEFRSSALAQARGEDTLATAHLALRFALASLDDHHSYFQTPAQMSAIAPAPVANARRGGTPRAPRAQLVAPSIGYLALPGFAGGEHADQVEFAQGIQHSLAGLEQTGACRWIVDLRGNQGGNVWPMLVGIGPLLGDGEVAAALYPDGRRRSVWYRDGKGGFGDAVQLRVPGEPFRPFARGPVAVLTDDDTASAAEIVTIAFRGSTARTRSFGAATSGATTATQMFALADGAAIVLAVAATVDPQGRAYSGGIVPDEPIDPAAGAADTLVTQPIIDRAVRWLQSTEVCTAGNRP